MPWTDKPGGSGSNGGEGPWGRPEGQNGGQPGGRRAGDRQAPDLEELLRSGRERFRRSGRGGGQGGSDGPGEFQMPSPRIFGIGAIVILALWLFSGIYQVSPGARGVVTTFGSYSGMTNSGLNWHLPWPIQSVEVVEVVEDRTVSLGNTQQRTLMLTSDLNIVDVGMDVNYRVAPDGAVEPGSLPNAAKFIFNIEEPRELVQAAAESALRQVVGESEFNLVINEDRSGVAVRTQEILQSILDEYDSGIQIIRLNFRKADPPAEVLPDQRDVIDARSEAERTVNRATQYRNQVVPEARGEARQIELDAEAYGQRVVLEARGAASRFNDIYSEYIQAPEVTRRRMYLETMEKILGSNRKVVIDDAAGGAVPYLNLNEIVRESQQNRRAPVANSTSGGL
ncbi:MAG: FtsH protease activity modulator HflK [Pseudomonadota bacterium]